MALNLKEQLEIQSGELKPVSIDGKMIDYVHAAAVNFAISFQSTHKVFTGSPKASIYLNKMLSATSKVIQSDSAYRQAAMVVMASFIASDGQMTKQTLEGATQTEYEDFIEYYIKSTIELFANVTVDEKYEYDNVTI